MEFAIYIFFRLIIFSFRITPFWVMYLYSDFFYFIIYYIVGYRKKVVYSNLKNSFPDKSDDEIKKIAKKFYSHFVDIMLESMKGITFPIEKLLKRYKAVNPEMINNFFDQGINTITVGGHYSNWEWGNQTADYLYKQKPIALYKPLSNKYIDAYTKKMRKQRGTDLYPIKFTKRAFEQNHGKPFSVIMIADQSPQKRAKMLWVKFLNQDTACLDGVEKYAKHYNLPVIFYTVDKIKRGYYTIKTEIITTTPNETAAGEITEKFMKLLEKSIIEKPEYYLWSHKRWKIKKEN